MSRSINSDKSWNSTDEEFDDCDNSSTSNSINRRICGDDIPGGCITTHSVSSVIRPGCKMPRNDPLQFVKIQHNELSKKAVEQIKLAEEVKITKEKIKEVEEEWQNNLLNWKSKRRQSKSNSEDESGTSLATNRKTKTFSEILSEKAKSGQRIGYNLHKYLDGELENENELRFDFNNSYESNDNDKNSDESYKSENDSMSEDNKKSNNHKNKTKKSNSRDVIVFDTSLLEEFSYNHKRQDSSEDSSNNIDSNSAEVINSSIKSPKNNCSSGDKNDLTISNNNNYDINNTTQAIDTNNDNNREETQFKDSSKSSASEDVSKTDKVRVEIKDWKHNNQRDNVLMYLLQQEQHQRQQQLTHEQVLSHHNDSYDAEEDDEDDEELERLRLDQEKSFKAKLSAFECLAKHEESNAVNNVNLNNNNKNKAREDSKRPPPAVKELLHSEQQQLQQRPLYSGQYEDIDNDSEDVVNARIQQLHIERQRAQQKLNVNNNPQQQQVIQQQQQVIQQQQPVLQQLPQNVIYQSPNYSQSAQNQNPSQHLSQQQRQHFDQQQYYLMDEPILKQNQTPVISPKQSRGPLVPPQTQHKQEMPYQQPIQPQEHLYVNQKQLLMSQQSNHHQYYDQLEPNERYGSPVREYYDESYKKPQIQQQIQQISQQIPQQTVETGAQPLQQTLQQPLQPPQLQPQNNQQIPKDGSHNQFNSSPHNQYLYYPKPYANKSPQQVPIQKPVMISQQQKQAPNPQTRQQLPQKQAKPQAPTPKPQQQQIGYNQNHWLLQEAELRRQLASIPTQSSIPSTVAATQRPTTSGSSQKTSSSLQKGMLSVSGKKKCSSCGDELGRGCAAMVVESLSLYYHINCFRCSVCNIQLGNGTVGTDVRVRNHKLHCQNCYSNDEAGLKFSRV